MKDKISEYFRFLNLYLSGCWVIDVIIILGVNFIKMEYLLYM